MGPSSRRVGSRIPNSSWIAAIAPKLLGCGGLFLCSLTAQAEVRELMPGDDFAGAVGTLNPGDELVLNGGTYTLPTARLEITRSGTAAAPIVIRSKGESTAVLMRTDANQNVLDLNASWVILRRLEISGGSSGIQLRPGAQNVTIEQCTIHDTAGNGVAATDSMATYVGTRVLRNHLYRTGNSAINLGCSTGQCRVIQALVEGNHIHNASGPVGAGIVLRESSYGGVIRDNVVHDARPCILVFTASADPTQANRIERNAVWRCSDVGIQATRDAVIRNNIILGATAGSIAVRRHVLVDAGTGNVQVVHNTVIDANGDGIVLADAVDPVLVANNAVYVSTGAAITVSGPSTTIMMTNNIGAGRAPVLGTGSLSADFMAANFSGMVPNDVFPKPGSALIGAAADAFGTTEDFHGFPRNSPATVGAIQFRDGGNPGWTLAAEPKPVLAPADGGNEAEDAGSGETEGGQPSRRQLSVSSGCSQSQSGEEWVLAFVLAAALAARRRRAG